MATCLPSACLSAPPPAQCCWRRLVAAACEAHTCRHRLRPLHTSRFPSHFLLPFSLYFRLSPSFSLHPDCQRMTFVPEKIEATVPEFCSFPPGVLTHPSSFLSPAVDGMLFLQSRQPLLCKAFLFSFVSPLSIEINSGLCHQEKQL